MGLKIGKNEMVNKYSYCMNLVKQVEKKYPVIQWTIDGIQVWPILRVNHSYEGKNESANCKNSKKNVNVIRFIYRKLCSLNNTIKRYRFLRKMEEEDKAHNDNLDGHRDIVFLSFSVYRKAQIDSLYYLTEVSPFLDKFKGYSYLILESAINDVWKYPRYGKSMFINKGKFVFAFLQKIKNKLFVRKNDEAHINCPQIHEVYKYLEERNVRLLSLKQLLSIVREINVLKLYYLKILKETTPKIVIIEWYYGLDGFALILAAKQMGIPVADIQHGMQDPNHWAYGDWPANKGGYQLLPDYFFVWTVKEKNNIQVWNELCGNKHKPIITGYQWLSMWKDKRNDFKRQIEQIKMIGSSECNVNILFSMSYNFLSEHLIQLIKTSPKNWQWWIRMHPVVIDKWGGFSEKFKQLFPEDNVIWDEASECALPALLSFVDLHITYGSTVACICQEWGIPSIVEDPKILDGSDLDSDLISVMPLDDLDIRYIYTILQNPPNTAKRIGELEQTELEFIREKILI